jgi:hypothetical protein
MNRRIEAYTFAVTGALNTSAGNKYAENLLTIRTHKYITNYNLLHYGKK